MEPTHKQKITVEVVVASSLDAVWERWTTPKDIMQWNNASDDWHTLGASNDLKAGGKFVYRMEAKDGSFGFDFGGIYDLVKPREHISYTIGDGRKVEINFTSNGTETRVVETFEAETENSLEMQRNGWQAILNNFKKYTESRS